jgi:hypothetical protein
LCLHQVSLDLALPISNGNRLKDNRIAHRVQCFSHLLNQFCRFQRNVLLSQ